MRTVLDAGRPAELLARGVLPVVPLLMVDLDNTLVDRDAAFAEAVTAFLAGHDLPGADLAWVMTLDAGGYASRDDVAAAMADRYRGLVSAGAVHALLDKGGADHVVPAELSRGALRRAVACGWACVIVTNGRVAQQETKIRRAGLDLLVQGWVISEAVGCKKPAPTIFQAAAGEVGMPLDGAWVVGDSPHADIAGAQSLGLGSVWVSNGKPWTGAASCRPTHVAADVATAIDYVISTASTANAASAAPGAVRRQD
ncbi:HAD family hydrolase [Streptomyces sp. YIM 130001]|uniref:HAD family hydrolase n=1 Tax=Streptomyces sp. YIM 130001 TaxID=2259644 RepID=UPI001F08E15B|nr:HAD family hydrolase [Streptomyces sp. YIM 130001]